MSALVTALATLGTATVIGLGVAVAAVLALAFGAGIAALLALARSSTDMRSDQLV
jgi:hypothetical protein